MLDKGRKDSKTIVYAIIIHLCSFLVPALLYAGIWKAKGIGIDNDYSPLIYDLKAQYLAFFSALQHIFKGEASIFYNWGISYGGSFLPIFAYYLSSPLNIIFAFFSSDELHIAIYVLTLLKIGLCGLTFSLFTRCELNKGKASFVQVIFSCCYAVMSYTVAYGMNLMWLDSVILLPLILLGIGELLRGKKGLFYFCSITLLFISNYYMAYIVGVFSAFYFITEIMRKLQKDNLKYCIRYMALFALHTINGLLVSAILLVPSFVSYLDATTTDEVTNYSTDGAGFFNTLIIMLKRLLPQQYDSVEYLGSPSIYCGTVVAFLAVAFLFQKNEIREKIQEGILLLILGLGFFVPVINVMWHAFRKPHSFPYRYAFLFSVVLLIYAYKAYIHVTETQKYVSVVAVLACYTLLELFMNGVVIVDGLQNELAYTSNASFEEAYVVYNELMEAVREDSRYSRVGKEWVTVSANDPLMFNVGGMDTCTSTYNNAMVGFLDTVGTDTMGKHVTCSRGQTAFVDAVLGVKYKLNMQKINYPYAEKLVLESGNSFIYLYENMDALSWGFTVPTECKDKFLFCGDGINNQNALAEALVGEKKEIYQPVEWQPVQCEEEMTIAFEYEADEKGEYLFYLDGDINVALKYQTEGEEHITVAKLDDVVFELFNNASQDEARIVKHIYSMHEVEAGKHLVKLKIPSYYDSIYVGVYRYCQTEYDEAISMLLSNEITNSVWENTSVSGQIVAGKEQILFTTIPYIKGIYAMIDDNYVGEIYKIGPFTAFDVPAGKHDVTIGYKQPGIKTGGLLCFFGFVSECITCCVIRKNRDENA